jgi:hypothetical protein
VFAGAPKKLLTAATIKLRIRKFSFARVTACDAVLQI